MVYLEDIHSSLFYYWNKYHLYNLIIFSINLGKFPSIDFLKHRIEFLRGKDNTDGFWKLGLFLDILCIDQLIGYTRSHLGSIRKSK